MATFNDAQDVHDTIGAFLEQITKDEDLRPKWVAANTAFHVVYTEPNAEMVIDCTVDPPVVSMGSEQADVCEIELQMSADDGHRFWLGELNMTLALAKGKVKVKGPVSKMMKLLPAMRPAFPKYRSFLAERGIGEA